MAADQGDLDDLEENVADDDGDQCRPPEFEQPPIGSVRVASCQGRETTISATADAFSMPNNDQSPSSNLANINSNGRYRKPTDTYVSSNQVKATQQMEEAQRLYLEQL